MLIEKLKLHSVHWADMHVEVVREVEFQSPRFFFLVIAFFRSSYFFKLSLKLLHVDALTNSLFAHDIDGGSGEWRLKGEQEENHRAKVNRTESLIECEPMNVFVHSHNWATNNLSLKSLCFF